MASTTYMLKPKAEIELATERETIFEWRKQGLITSDKARDLYLALFDRLTQSEKLQPYDPTSPIGVQCADCLAVHVMAIDVKSYTCKCSPHTERSTLRLRVVLV